MVRVLLCKSDDHWASHITVRNIMKHISPEFECVDRVGYRYQKGDEDFDVIYFHCNLSFGEQQIREVREKCPDTKLVAGVRGWIGFKKTQHMMPLYDALNADNLRLYEAVKKHHPHVSLCHAGVDTELFRPLKLKKYGDFVVGWAGLRGPAKNWRILDRLGYEAKTATRRRNSQGRLLPDIKHRNMPKWYNRLSVYLQPSTWGDSDPTGDAEGCPLPVLEAGACAVPVLATSTSGAAREYLTDWQIIHGYIGDGGFRELKEKLEVLRGDAKARRRIGERNRRVAVEKWSWDLKARQYENFFKSTL